MQANGVRKNGVEVQFALLERRIVALERELASAKAHQSSSAAATPASTHSVSTNSDDTDETTDSVSPTGGEDRYITIFRKWDKDDKEYKETRALTPAKHIGVEKGRVLTYRKILDKLNLSVVDWEIDIEDKTLLDTLKTCYKEVCPGDKKSWAEEKQTIYFPFRVIVWCYDKLELRGRAVDGDNELALKHKADIRALLQIVREVPPLVDYFKIRESTPDQIAFKYIWAIFPVSQLRSSMLVVSRSCDRFILLVEADHLHVGRNRVCQHQVSQHATDFQAHGRA